MNSLMGYGSDDDCDGSSDENPPESQNVGTSGPQNDGNKASRGSDGGTPPQKSNSERQQQLDANYEEVQMDLSEESNDSKSDRQRSSKDRDSSSRRERHDRDRSRRDRDKDRHRDRRERDRDRKSRRSSSRDRRRSERDRERSRSRDRSSRRHNNKRYERQQPPSSSSSSSVNNRNHTQTNDKATDPSRPTVEPSPQQPSDSDRFFMPGITGRFREQIERRKLLWQKKEPDGLNQTNSATNLLNHKTPIPTKTSVVVRANNPTGAPTVNRTGKVWEATTFAQDTDGKVASKFKRLMGIKKPSSEANGPASDVLKKQEEMFSSMEQQYEVARTATHTMRGVGLGFGSYQR